MNVMDRAMSIIKGMLTSARNKISVKKLKWE